MSTAHARRAVAIALAAIVAGACAGDNEVADLTTVAPPPSATAADTTIESTVAGTTTEPTTTEPATTESAATAASIAESDLSDGPTFSDALGVRVDTAPGVHTRGDTRQLLPEGLYVHVAWEADPNDPSVFTVQPDDIEILEAYANAVRVFYETALGTLVIDPARFSPFMLDSGAQFEAKLTDARLGGYVDSLGAGVVLRPYVPADGSSEEEAVVLDCTLSDEAFVLRSDQSRTSDPVARGQLATMKRVDGSWKVDVFAEEPQACV